MKKGFTLIELLIVITIIGILAVALLPSILGAPSKARDAQRIADLQRIQKVIIAGDLEGNDYPTSTGCVANSGDFTDYLADLGGAIPTDPSTGGVTYDTTTCSNGEYYYIVDPGSTGQYAFALLSVVENAENANASCNSVNTSGAFGTPGTGANQCYAILSQ